MYKDILKKINVDAIFITDPINMRYISGFDGEGMLYISKSKDVIITDSRYTEAASNESSFEVIEEKFSNKRVNILSDLIDADKAVSVGFENRALTCGEFSDYESKLKQIERWIPLEKAVDELRLIKSEKEIEYLHKASEIADAAFEKLCTLIRPGMTELEGAAELEYRMKLLGADKVGFDTIFAAGKHSSMPHAVPTDYKVQAGDFITIDFGCKYKGYCSDTTRTIVVGKASPKQKEIYDIVLKAHLNAMSAVREGVTGHEVDAAARDIIKAAGYGPNFGHSTGHGVGLYIHEEPRFAQESKTVYKAGMTGTIEPGIYLPGVFGVRIEDMIVVTEDGCRSFTRLPKELLEL